MEVKYFVIFALAVIAAVNCAPAKEDVTTDSSSEVEMVPLSHSNSAGKPETTYGDKPIIDTGVFGPFSFNPFGGLFQTLEGMLLRMRQQMSQILNRLPNRNDTSDGLFPDLHIPHIGGIDLGKGNTTSVTKIIDGHKVVINETEYKQENENGGAIFKVRIIDVKPDSSETTERDVEDIPAITSAPVRDRESVEDTVENEISKSKEESNYKNLETFDEVDEAHSSAGNEFDDLNSYGSFEDNAVYHPGKIIDLSRDTYVNELAAQAGVTPDPEAEFLPEHQHASEPIARSSFEKIISKRKPKHNLINDVYVNELLANDRRTMHNPDAEIFNPTYENAFENIVVDRMPNSLMNDISVNELRANSNEFEINPDAEIFDPIEAELDAKNNHIGQFEKLLMPR